MTQISMKTLVAGALLTLPALGFAQSLPIGVATQQTLKAGQRAYTLSLAEMTPGITAITSNQNVTVTTETDRFGDPVYKYKGLYATVDWDEEDDTFESGMYLSSPPCNMTVDADAKTVTFGWEGMENADWSTDCNNWLTHYIGSQTDGAIRLTIPEGLISVTGSAGTFSNEKTVIYYDIVGNRFVADIKSVTPAAGSIVKTLSDITLDIDFTGMENAPEYLSENFVASDLKLDYLAPGATKATRQYEPKNIEFKDGKLNITFTKDGAPYSYTAPGEYTLSGKAKALTFSATNDGTPNAVCGAFSYSWNIEVPETKYGTFSPVPGTLDMNINPEGPAAITFSLQGASKEDYGKRNPDKLAYATLSRDGEVIARVPNTNYRLVTFDNFYAFVWNISFWERPNKRASLPGEYIIDIEEGFFVLNDLPSQAKTLKYIVKGKEYTVAPAAGTVTSIEKVTFTWPAATSVAIDETSENLPEIYNRKSEEGLPEAITYVCEGNSVIITADPVITAGGVYDVTLPAGCVKLTYGEGDSAVTSTFAGDVTETFTINGEPAFRPILALDETIEFIPGEITLNAPEEETFNQVNNMEPCYIYPINEDGSYAAYVARYSAQKSNEGKSITLKNLAGVNTDLYLANGEYALVFPRFIFNTMNEATWNSEMVYAIVVKNDNKPYVSNPYDGQYIKKFTQVEVTFNEAVTIDAKNTLPATVTDGVNSYLAGLRMKEGDDKTVLFTAVTPIDYEGEYTLVAPTAVIKSAKANEETKKINVYDVRTSFVVVGENGQAYIPAPEVASSEFNGSPVTVTLTYPENGSVNAEIPAALFKVENGEREQMFVFENAEVKDNVVTLNTAVELYLEDGTYELVIPEGFFYNDNAISKAFTHKFNFVADGVESIFGAENEALTVYNLQGICLMRNADASRLATLPAGLYIINGRKVVIRK
ncbi:MAG: hypothetical protein HDS70_00595 [Bacteroidales bacterium]|nr:hypothetical protein [Bacteroidales bacterium]